MIPRIRPYFDRGYIDAVMNYDPDHNRSDYFKEAGKKISEYYPSSESEFIDLGRNGLGIALDILDIARGDEIIIPCFTCSSVLEPVINRGVIPVLADVNYDFTMNGEEIKKNLSENTKAVLVTHFFGIPSNIEEISEIAEDNSLFIIEDCANIFCAKVRGIKPGNIGDLSFTSFKNDKPLSLGKGGALLLNNKEYSDKFHQIFNNMGVNGESDEISAFLSLLSFYCITDEGRYDGHIGGNDYYSFFNGNSSVKSRTYGSVVNFPDILIPRLSKNRCMGQHFYGKVLRFISGNNTESLLMGNYSLNLLCTAVDRINKINEARVKNARLYQDYLAESSEICLPEDVSEIPLLRYPLVCRNRKLWHLLKKELFRNQIEVSNYNWSPSLDKILKVKGDYKFSNHLADNILNLPNHMYLSEESVQNICNIINFCTES